MKNLLEFKLENGESAFVEIEEADESQSRQRVSRGGSNEGGVEPLQAQRSFNDAIKCITPIGNSLLSSLKEINTPDEISLEFGFKFSGKAGIVFTSAESEASFKVSITWKNKKPD